MQISKTKRGFSSVLMENYPPDGKQTILVRESSMVGDYPDALRNPGSSALWVGDHHHLSREDVAELVGYMRHWLRMGRLGK